MFEDVYPPVASILIAEIAPGERVLWHAKPSFVLQMHFRGITFLIGIGIAILLAGIAWMAWIYVHFAPLSHLVAVLPIAALFALYFLIFAFIPLLLWYASRGTLYVVTDRRAIVIHRLFGRRRIQSFTGEQLIRVTRLEDKRGRGDIIFERGIGFLGIKSTRDVTKLLRRVYEAGLTVYD